MLLDFFTAIASPYPDPELCVNVSHLNCPNYTNNSQLTTELPHIHLIFLTRILVSSSPGFKVSHLRLSFLTFTLRSPSALNLVRLYLQFFTCAIAISPAPLTPYFHSNSSSVHYLPNLPFSILTSTSPNTHHPYLYLKGLTSTQAFRLHFAPTH